MKSILPFAALALTALSAALLPTKAPAVASQDARTNAVSWVQNAAEYRLAARQAYRHAQHQLEVALADPNWTADEVQHAAGDFAEKAPAVILDVDETVLDNSPYNARGIVDRTSFDMRSWTAWVNEQQAMAIPGVQAFAAFAKSKGVALFFVTNRDDVHRAATIANLTKLGFEASEANVLTRNAQAGRGGDKVSRRAMVAQEHRILLLIGDNMSDLCSGVDGKDLTERNRIAAEKERRFGKGWVMLPNPVYGRWVGDPSALRTARQHDHVRVATYNIRWLSSETTTCGSVDVTDVRTQSDQYGKRLDRLREIVATMDADVIGLQEIRDRKALDLIFEDNGDWTIVIDDDSDECQDLALAVRAPLTVKGAQGRKLNANANHFLFEEVSPDFFPRSRDVLHVEVLVPGSTEPLHVLVHHAKSRSGGREETNWRREGASKIMVERLKAEFADRRYVLLGDFNDNPDDRSVNILETGNPDAVAEMENEPGSFLINLTEELVAKEIVTLGRSWKNVLDDRIELAQYNSRAVNFHSRTSNSYDPSVGVLFDQIFLPAGMIDLYVPGSITVYDRGVAVSGVRGGRASDHMPVYADLRIPVAK